MQQSLYGKPDPGPPEIDPEFFLGWWHLFVTALCKSCYKAIAEDVASILVLKMLIRGRNGHKLPDLRTDYHGRSSRRPSR